MRPRVLAEYSILIALSAAGLVTVLLFHERVHDPGFVFVIAFATFAAVVGAAMLIAWAAEASQFSISQGLALAVVAIVQTLPEFFVEGDIARRAGIGAASTSLVIANFTGANRLLTGLGWPLILFTMAIQRRRKGKLGRNTISLRAEHSVEVVFMLAASLYYIVIMVKGTLTLVDTVLLMGAFLVYMWVLSKLPAEKENPKEVLAASPLALVELQRARNKAGAIVGLFLFSAAVFAVIVDPFVISISVIAVLIAGQGTEFFFIQWIAPFLSEFPEKVTTFNWARKVRLAPMALLNFVSSSVSELTSLVAIIPIVYIVSRGSIESIPVTEHNTEILLTMAQSLYACAALLDMEYDARNALILFGLWLVSTVFVEARFIVSVTFLLLALMEVALHRGHITTFHNFRKTVNEHVLRTGRRDRP